LVILWIFNVAMGNHHFLKVNHHKSCGNETFSIAMLNNQRVYGIMMFIPETWLWLEVFNPWNTRKPPGVQRFFPKPRNAKHRAGYVGSIADRYLGLWIPDIDRWGDCSHTLWWLFLWGFL
jgi:hypothetical protein